MASVLGKLRSMRGRPKRIVAVDFDSRQIRLVEAQRVGEQMRIVRMSSSPVPPGTEIADPKILGQLLAGALKELRLSGVTVVMNVPRGQAILKTLTLPPGTGSEQLASMVRYQVEKELPFRLEEAVIDFTIESHFGGSGGEAQAKGVNVLVAAVRVPVVDYYRQVALTAKVPLASLGLRPYANHFCVNACGTAPPDAPRAVVHVTADETEIDVLAGDSLAFSRSAVGKSPADAAADPEAAKDAVNFAAAEAARSLQSYQSVEGGGKIRNVFVAGGTGIEASLARELARRLGVACQVLDVATRLGLDASGGQGSEFISALGLVIGYGQAAALPFDFLSPRRPPAQRDMRRVRIAAVVVGAMAVLSTVALAREMYIGGLEDQKRNLQGEQTRQLDKKKLVEQAEARVKTIEAWDKDRFPWLNHLAYISCLMPSCKDAYITGFKANADGSMTFTVRAVNEQTITELSEQLEAAGYDRKVTRQSKTSDNNIYMHVADMEVKVTRDTKADPATTQPQSRPADDVALQEIPPRRTYSGTPAPSPTPRPEFHSGENGGSDANRPSDPNRPRDPNRPSGRRPKGTR